MRTPPFRYAVSAADLDAAPADGDRLLMWLARRQWRTIVGGILMGTPWMVAIAMQPAAIGKAIDAGIVPRDRGGLLLWSAVIAGLGVVIGVLATARHFFAVRNWLHASFRANLVADHGIRRAGPALTREVPAGEVLTSITTDFGRMGQVFDVSARFSGALAAFVVVATILLRTSVTLGLVLLLGGPLLMSSLALVVRALGRRQEAQRAEFGALAALGTDTVAGLRVLRGIGGEGEFLRRYAAQSARVRASGVRLAGVQALLEAAQVLLPGVFVLVVVGVGARLALAGEISAGQLVAFFGYTAFLTTPLRTAVEFVEKLTATRVAARRIARILAVSPDHPESPGSPGPVNNRPIGGLCTADPVNNRPIGGLWTADPVNNRPIGGLWTADPVNNRPIGGLCTPDPVNNRPIGGLCTADPVNNRPIGGLCTADPVNNRPIGGLWTAGAAGELVDPVSGTRIVIGSFTALVSARPEDAAEVLERLGRTAPGRHGVTWAGTPIDDWPIGEIRQRALVSAAHPDVFSGPLRTELAPSRPDDELLDALHVANAEDVLDALPEGLSTHLEERGRSLSGGQRQRMVLARALLTQRAILLLVEPTSAVDAHTEARIVTRLKAARASSTTVVTTASPLVLEAADEVILLQAGRATTRGTHADLVREHAAYREIVTRGEAT